MLDKLGDPSAGSWHTPLRGQGVIAAAIFAWVTSVGQRVPARQYNTLQDGYNAALGEFEFSFAGPGRAYCSPILCPLGSFQQVLGETCAI